MMSKRFHNLGQKLLSKLGRYLLAAVIGYITWAAVVGKSNGQHGEQLFREGREIYEEQKQSTASHYEMTDDSSYIYVREK